jgi:hypothetical protein
VGELPIPDALVQTDAEAPSALPTPPTTVHQAYCRGWDSARRGEDFASVVYDAYQQWPRDDVRAWCELVASASLGHQVGAEGRADH